QPICVPRTQVFRALAQESCQFDVNGSELLVSIPGWDRHLIKHVGPHPVMNFFWDRIRIKLGDQVNLRDIRPVYWSTRQTLLHLLFTVMAASEHLFGTGETTLGQFLVLLVFGNLIPLVAAIRSTQVFREKVLRAG